jgi:hypothetical protein
MLPGTLTKLEGTLELAEMVWATSFGLTNMAKMAIVKHKVKSTFICLGFDHNMPKLLPALQPYDFQYIVYIFYFFINPIKSQFSKIWI